MNTRISYLYRDACNYKVFNDAVIAGRLSLDQLTPYLKDRTFFIPSEVGLPDLQPNEFSPDDHIWHEIESIEETSDVPTVDITATNMLENFKQACKSDWNEYRVYEKKGVI